MTSSARIWKSGGAIKKTCKYERKMTRKIDLNVQIT